MEGERRSLKRTVDMDQLSAKTKDRVEQDLRLGVAADNLGRTTLTLAAQRLAIAPRSRSFSCALEASEAKAEVLFYRAERHNIDRFLDDCTYRKWRRAKKKPTEPRMVLPTKRQYPLLRVPREGARLTEACANKSSLKSEQYLK